MPLAAIEVARQAGHDIMSIAAAAPTIQRDWRSSCIGPVGSMNGVDQQAIDEFDIRHFSAIEGRTVKDWLAS